MFIHFRLSALLPARSCFLLLHLSKRRTTSGQSHDIKLTDQKKDQWVAPTERLHVGNQRMSHHGVLRLAQHSSLEALADIMLKIELGYIGDEEKSTTHITAVDLG